MVCLVDLGRKVRFSWNSQWIGKTKDLMTSRFVYIRTLYFYMHAHLWDEEGNFSRLAFVLFFLFLFESELWVILLLGNPYKSILVLLSD